MNRRLRKKTRLGEFQELGFSVTYSPAAHLTDAAREALLWSFVLEAVEANGLATGGGGGGTVELFAVADARRGSATAQQRSAVHRWLEREPGIATFAVGPLVDAWYGWAD